MNIISINLVREGVKQRNIAKYLSRFVKTGRYFINFFLISSTIYV